MRVRTQLVLAFLLLAVVPLAGIVVFSYQTSQDAIRRAVAAESTSLAVEMGDRLDGVREEISQRLGRIAVLPKRSLLPGGVAGGEAIQVYTDLLSGMGAAPELVDWFEFSPAAEAGSQEPLLIYPSATLTKALRRLLERESSLADSGLSPEYLESIIQQAVRGRELLAEPELRAVEARGAEIEALLGTEFTSPVLRGDDVVGELKAFVPAMKLLLQVLARTPRDRGEVPFARDADGHLYVDRPQDELLLEEVGVALAEAGAGSGRTAVSPDWIVVETPDQESGLIFGIARPIAEPLREIRRTAVRNLGYGLALVALAMAGVLWLSGRMTRNLVLLTDGAERLAGGDLEARVPVTSRNEFGALARTFNRMAAELREKQVRLLDEERSRREEEVRRRLLEAENERKSRELEEARQFQLSLLPERLPDHPEVEVAVFMKTAAEVGGDYYDFFPSQHGAMTAVVGDAAGHGARAGTLVTVVKGLLTAGAAEAHLASLLTDASRAIKRMNLGRMNMAVTLARIHDRTVTISAAGMPPVLLYRSQTGSIEEILLPGTPLGGIADATYDQWSAELTPGDTLLMMTDGFPELLNRNGEVLGYQRARSLFEETVSRPPARITEVLARAAEEWTGGEPPGDDVTFLVLRKR